MNFPVIFSKTIGRGLPVVLLHAFPLSAEIWKDLRPPTGFRLILPDFPGFGSSPLAPKGLSLEQTALGLQEHLENLGVKEPIILGGISMGGYWAFEYVRLFPEKVKKLFLISTRAGADKLEGRQKRLGMAERAEKEGIGFLAETMLPGLLGKTTQDQKSGLVQAARRWIETTSPQAVALAQRAMAKRRDQTDILPRIKAKTLILAGSEDSLIPVSEAEVMAQAIPGSQLQILDQVGHLIPLEDLAAFQKITDEFLLAAG